MAQVLARELRPAYRVRLTERIPVRSEVEFVSCALAAGPETAALARGVDAIVHVAEPLPDEGDIQRIDYLTHRTYNLLMAASTEKVSRVVYLSTLELMTAYDPDFTVSERFRPMPGCDAFRLAKHLGEYVCREFARERKLNVTVLRLGKVVRAGEVSGMRPDPTWVEERDVAAAVAAALPATFTDTASSLGTWAVFHIASESPDARFSSAKAVRELHYNPRFRWS
jgi:nucleoside-diphosphate-sugar epimerase